VVDPESILALRRKLGTATNPFSLAGNSPPKALRLAFARACENVARFEAAVTDFAESKASLAQVVGDLNHFDLIQAIKSPTGAAGLAIWDGQALSAFIEQLVTGRVVPSEAEGRAATPTDGALIGVVLDAILAGFDAELEQTEGVPGVKGFKSSGTFSDGRAVSMALKDVPYRRYVLSLALGNGAKTGQLQLVFPWGGFGAKSNSSTGRGWDAIWHHAVADARAPVSAVLHRLSLPLSDVTKFQIGTLVPIPTVAIGKVSLEGFDQRMAATGRLGQSNGFRAIRVTVPVGDHDMAQSQVPFENAQAKPQVATLAPTSGGGHRDATPAQPDQPTTQTAQPTGAVPQTVD